MRISFSYRHVACPKMIEMPTIAGEIQLPVLSVALRQAVSPCRFPKLRSLALLVPRHPGDRCFSVLVDACCFWFLGSRSYWSELVAV